MFLRNAAAFITPIYQNLLRRNPDDGGMYYYASQINNPGACSNIARAIAESPESMYQDVPNSRLPGMPYNPFGIVLDTYRGVLGREADMGGLQYWYQVTIFFGRNYMISSIISSPEFQNRCAQLGIHQ